MKEGLFLMGNCHLYSMLKSVVSLAWEAACLEKTSHGRLQQTQAC